MAADQVPSVGALLGEAEEAHGVYETNELGGVYDEAWPAWYARWLVDHGLGHVLGREVSADRLADLLRGSFEDFKTLDPSTAGSWAAYTAQRIADEL